MKLNAEGTLAMPAATLTTEQVDQLMHDLAKLRQQMQPPVKPNIGPDDILLPQVSPAIFCGKTADGEICLGLRHEGLGWCTFTLPVATAATLRNFIAKRIGEDGGLSDTPIARDDSPKH